MLTPTPSSVFGLKQWSSQWEESSSLACLIHSPPHSTMLIRLLMPSLTCYEKTCLQKTLTAYTNIMIVLAMFPPLNYHEESTTRRAVTVCTLRINAWKGNKSRGRRLNKDNGWDSAAYVKGQKWYSEQVLMEIRILTWWEGHLSLDWFRFALASAHCTLFIRLPSYQLKQ